MRSFKMKLTVTFFFPLLFAAAEPSSAQDIQLLVDDIASPVTQYGAELLAEALNQAGASARVESTTSGGGKESWQILIGAQEDFLFEGTESKFEESAPKGAFHVSSAGGQSMKIVGAGANGVLYGCQAMATMVESGNLLGQSGFASIKLDESPSLSMRALEAPFSAITDESTTPQWLDLLDKMAAWRLNTLILWNADLGLWTEELPDWMIEFLARCDQRGIRVHFEFPLETPAPTSYWDRASELVGESESVGFALNLASEKAQSAYTPESGQAFFELTENPLIAKVDLRRVASLVPPPGGEWITYSDFALGLLTDPPAIHPQEVAFLSQDSPGPRHAFRIPIHGSIAPYTWMNSQISQGALKLVADHGGQGMVVPSLSPESFPWSHIQCDPPQAALEHDWLWFESWSRYAWNHQRDPGQENLYWENQLQQRYGFRKRPRDLRESLEGASALVLKAARSFAFGHPEESNYLLGMPWDRVTYASSPWPPGIDALPLTEYIVEDEKEDLLESQATEEEPYERRDLGVRPDFESSELTRLGVEVASKLENAGKGATQRQDELNRLLRDIGVVRRIGYYWGAWPLSSAHALAYIIDGEENHLSQILLCANQGSRALSDAALLANHVRDACSTPQTRFPRGRDTANHLRETSKVIAKEAKRIEANVNSIRDSNFDPYHRQLLIHRISADLSEEMISVPAAGAPGAWLLFEVALAVESSSESVHMEVRATSEGVDQLIQPIVVNNTAWEGYALYFGHLAGRTLEIEFRKIQHHEGVDLLLSQPTLVSGVLPDKVGTWWIPETAKDLARLGGSEESKIRDRLRWLIAGEHARFGFRIHAKDQVWPLGLEAQIPSTESLSEQGR